jgi:hypothetical protein
MTGALIREAERRESMEQLLKKSGMAEACGNNLVIDLDFHFSSSLTALAELLNRIVCGAANSVLD